MDAFFFKKKNCDVYIGPGVYQGRLVLESQHMADDLIDNAQLIP